MAMLVQATLALAPKSKSHALSKRDGRNVHATSPLATRMAITVSSSGGGLENRQSAVLKTTSPRSGRSVPDDQTLPQPSSSRVPDTSVSVWNSHTGFPVSRLAATTYPREPFWPSVSTPKSTLPSVTTGDDMMRAPSLSGLGGRSGYPV